jgi:hypothetical protein
MIEAESPEALSMTSTPMRMFGSERSEATERRQSTVGAAHLYVVITTASLISCIDSVTEMQGSRYLGRMAGYRKTDAFSLPSRRNWRNRARASK